jgi:hypothetical protein
MKRGPGPPEEGGGARTEKRTASEAGKKRSLLNALAKLAGTQVTYTLIPYLQAHYLQSLISCFRDKFCVKILFCKHPVPGSPKTFGSGFPALVQTEPHVRHEIN